MKSESSSDDGRVRMKCVLIAVLLSAWAFEPSWSSCSFPQHVKSGTVQVLHPNNKPNPGTGKYPENAEARVECSLGFRLSFPEAQYLTCTNGEWMKHSSVKSDDSICVPVQCGRPPSIDNGHYTSEKTRFKLVGDRAGETYPVGTILIPACEHHFYINCTVYCGRISCSADGIWTPKDGNTISKCVAQLLSNSAPSHEDRGGSGSSTTSTEANLKHYLIIILAVVCILIVGALTVLLLRRPTFCKKHGGRSGASGGGTGNNYNPNMLRSHEEASVSPVPANLDSLPVAMNTGIFIPGGSYDWQECRFQEATLTGTSVFK